MRPILGGLVAALTLGASSLPGAAEPLLAGEPCVAREPADYRRSNFLAPVPCTLAGGNVVYTDELVDLIAREQVILVDVLPSPRRPEGLAADALWQPKARRNIPDSAWLPNTGFGELPVEEEAYLRRNLDRLTQGDKSRHLVFYCLADCWMSWNAARRALAWGYTAVTWYPCGTDGWKAAGLPLAASLPVPR